MVLRVRPAESTLQKCQQLLNQASGDDDEEPDVAIKLGNLGVFDKQSVEIWTKAMIAANVKRKVAEEEMWLSNNRSFLTSTQLQEVSSLLFDSRPQQEILRFGKVIVDINDLSNLVAERYLTGFLIDGVCLKYCQEAEADESNSIYLPSFMQTWDSTGNHKYLQSKLKPYVSGNHLKGLQWLLTPIHVNSNHWGPLCLNVVSCEAFFDDGLKVNPPPGIDGVILTTNQIHTQLQESHLTKP